MFQRLFTGAARFAPILISIAVFLCFVASGCGGGGGGGGKTSGQTTSISGTVHDSANGDAGVGGATVTIGGATTTTVTTDQANATNPVGTFVLQNPAQGAKTAAVTINGTTQTLAFDPAIGPGVNSSIDLYINIGQVSGVVFLPNGDKAANAFVSIAANGDTTTTKSDGSFLLINVPVGATQLSIVSGTASLSKDITIGNGVTDAGELHLLADTNPNPPPSPKTITGKVILGGGVGAASGTSVALLRGDVQIEAVFTDSTGGYSFYVPVGTYTLQFRRSTFVDQTVGGVTVSDPSTPLVVPDVTLQPSP